MKASLPIAKEFMNDGSVAATMKLVAGCVAVVLFLFRRRSQTWYMK